MSWSLVIVNYTQPFDQNFKYVWNEQYFSYIMARKSCIWWYDNDIPLYVVCLAGKQTIPILSYLVGRDQGSNPQYITFEVEHA
jgi:hypothetical protein